MLDEEQILAYSLVCEGLLIDDLGVATGTVFQEIRPGAGFKTGDFAKEKCLFGGRYHRWEEGGGGGMLVWIATARRLQK